MPKAERHQASCDQARTVVSKDLGHLFPPLVSGKTKEVRAEFPAGRPLLISTFAFAAGAPVPPTFLCPELGHVRFGSLEDIRERIRDVRFTPDSGHSSVQVGCPRSAISGLRGMTCFIAFGSVP